MIELTKKADHAGISADEHNSRQRRQEDAAGIKEVKGKISEGEARVVKLDAQEVAKDSHNSFLS